MVWGLGMMADLLIPVRVRGVEAAIQVVGTSRIGR